MPPFSGFYSKDSILGQALDQKNYLLFALGAVVAGLTTFYMFRLFFVVFLGKPRTEAAEHAHESPAVMAWPLLVLAVFAVIGGVIGISRIYAAQFSPGEAALSFGQSLVEPLVHSPVGALVGLAFVAAGFLAARKLYRDAVSDPLPAKLGGLGDRHEEPFLF